MAVAVAKLWQQQVLNQNEFYLLFDTFSNGKLRWYYVVVGKLGPAFLVFQFINR